MATTIRTDISSKVDIVARKDDTFQLKLNITKSDGTALNLTDASALFTVRSLDNSSFLMGAESGTNNGAHSGQIQDDNDTPKGISSDGSTGALGADGVLVVHIAQSITNGISAGVYLYGLQITQSNNLSQTFLSGKFTLNEDITGDH
jgi:hypothetical protein